MTALDQDSFNSALIDHASVILLVDDDVMALNFMALVLQREGYAVMVAGDGHEAIELSRSYRGQIDMLLTDMQMPRMGGQQLVTLLREERPSVKILQISGFTSAADPDVPFLQKPFRSALLKERVASILGRKPRLATAS